MDPIQTILFNLRCAHDMLKKAAQAAHAEFDRDPSWKTAGDAKALAEREIELAALIAKLELRS